MMRSTVKYLLVLITLVLLAACGGGGSASTGGGNNNGGNNGANNPPPQAPVVVQSTLKVALAGVNTPVSGLTVTVTLPAGVSIALNNDGSIPAATVSPSGVLAPESAALVPGSITWDSANNRVSFIIYSTAAGGFGSGEFATLACLVTGTAPAASAFAAQLEPYDLVGNALSTTGVTASFVLAP